MKNLCLKFYRHSFLRYLVAGGGGFVVDYGTLTFCLRILHWHYLVASTLGFIAGLALVYFLSNVWVFTERKMERHALLEFAIFAIIGISGLLFTVLLMWGFVDGLGIHPQIAKLITTALVLLWNYGARKVILY